MTPPFDWSAVTAARLPSERLGSLGAVRHRADVRVTVTPDGDCWVHWPAGPAGGEVVTALRPAAGVEFYARHPDGWRRAGSRLPSATFPPTDTGRLLAEVLTPAALTPTLATGGVLRRARVELVRDDGPQPATAMRCTLRALRDWADTATTKQLAGLLASVGADEALLLGALPPIASARRYWGDAVRLPLGFTLRPALGPASVRALLQAAANDLVFWDADGVDVVPTGAFGPVTRAGVRLAAEAGALT